MRLKDLELKESLPGRKGITRAKDAQKWVDACRAGDASEKDMSLFNQLKSIKRKLGGKTTVIEVLKIL